MSSGAGAGAGADAGADADAGAGAGAGADAGAGAGADASAGADAAPGAPFGFRSGEARGGICGAWLRVHATKTSASHATIGTSLLTDPQGKPAFVLGEHPIVSLLTIRALQPSNGFVPTGPRGTKPA
jgi:hypothetical protein